MKRYGNLWGDICDYNNLVDAHLRARRGKLHYKEVKHVNANLESSIKSIQKQLLDGTYTTSPYTHITRVEGGKQRDISKLPYYPDRIVHHALFGVIGNMLIRSLIRDTFQSLPERGVSDARKRIWVYMRRHKPRYAVKLDIRKFYQSVHIPTLKTMLRRKLKCKPTLNLIDNILDSHDGLPIGNYTSQLFGNVYLSGLDWYCKQDLSLTGYFRYCDDILVFAESPHQARTAARRICKYIGDLGLKFKPPHHIDLTCKPVDFIGYSFCQSKVRLRSNIRRSMFLKLLATPLVSSPSYNGWCKPIQARNIYKLYGGIYESIKQ